MRITVDRSISSNGVPAAAPPKGADSRALHARYRSVDSARIARTLTSERVRTLSSPAAAGGRPKRQPVQVFSITRGELEKRQLHGNTTDKGTVTPSGSPLGAPDGLPATEGGWKRGFICMATQRRRHGHAVGVALRGPRRPNRPSTRSPVPGWTTEGGEAAPAAPCSLAPAPGTGWPTALDYESGVGNEVHLYGNTTDKAWFMPSGSPLGAPDGRPAVDTILRARGGRPGSEAALAAPRFRTAAPGTAGLVVLDYESGA
jgi:hypothetical protein